MLITYLEGLIDILQTNYDIITAMLLSILFSPLDSSSLLHVGFSVAELC